MKEANDRVKKSILDSEIGTIYCTQYCTVYSMLHIQQYVPPRTVTLTVIKLSYGTARKREAARPRAEGFT